MNHQLDFFMGAVSPDGFHNYFPSLAEQPDLSLYLLKSGPGCGKSTLMRHLAAQAWGPVEHIHCSSDPDSLDAAVLWKNHAAILDATAPHIMEPRYPGVREHVVSLYDALDTARLAPYHKEIPELFDVCHTLHQRAGRYISAAGALLLENRRTVSAALNRAKAERYARHLAARELPRNGPGASEQIRLLSAVTLKGVLVYRDTVPKLAGRVIVFHDEYGTASSLILAVLRQEALNRGHAVISCHCPMAPADKLEHLFLPELSVAFVTSNSWHPMQFPGQQNIHCQRFMDPQVLRQNRFRMRFSSRAAKELLEQASSLQAEAKQNHDKLEKLYQSAIDFSKVDAVGDSLARTLGL